MGCSGSGQMTSSYLCPGPQLQTRALWRSRTRTFRRDQVPLRSPSRRRPAPPERQGSRQHPAIHGSRDPPCAPIPRATLPGRKPQVGGRRGAHLRRRRGALHARCRGSSRGGHVVRPRPLLLPGTPLPSPPHASCPQNVGLLGKKFGCSSDTPSAAPRHPPRAASPPRCTVSSARQVPARPGARGAGPAQVEARRPAERARGWLPWAHEHAQSAGARAPAGAGRRGPYLRRRGAEGPRGSEGEQVLFPAGC